MQTRRYFNFNTFFKHIFYACIHTEHPRKRTSLATLSRIQTEPWRWTDGDMGTGSLKSHISIYICWLARESDTAKPNKQLLAKHTHTHTCIPERQCILFISHIHTPSLSSHSSKASPHTTMLVWFPTVIMQV